MIINFVSKLKEVIEPLMDNIWIYLFISFIVFLLGDFDEVLFVLFILNLFDYALSLASQRKKSVFFGKIKMYIVISVGVMVDKILGLEGNGILKFRGYLILAYSYNEVLSILMYLSEDDSFFIPTKFRKYLERMNSKMDEEIK